MKYKIMDVAFSDVKKYIIMCVHLHYRFLVRVAYLEIYNEEVRDLLGKDQTARLEVSLKSKGLMKSFNTIEYISTVCTFCDKFIACIIMYDENINVDI